MTRWLLAFAALSAALPAAASDRFTLGARAGYAVGLGYLDGASRMNDAVGEQIPIQLDAAYRVRPDLGVGAYLAYGFGRVSGDLKFTCGAGCSADALRVGAQVLYYFPGERSAPWIGLGAGWESISVDTGAVRLKVTGWELLVVQGGIDVHESARLSLGGFLSASLGRYTEQQVGGLTTPLDERMHEWVTLGVRGEFKL
jgi:hypothetical protein